MRLTPKSSADRIEGVGTAPGGGAALLVRVRALPQDGAANTALIALLARTLKLPKSDLSLASGDRGRIKRVHARGDQAGLRRALDHLTAGLSVG